MRDDMRAFLSDVGRESERLAVGPLTEQLPAIAARATAPRHQSRRVLHAVAIFAAGATALAFMFYPRALTYEVAGQKATAGHVVSSGASAKALAFSDGSQVALDPESRARVVRLDRAGAEVVLDSGVAHANIVHRSDTRWTFSAGPFLVRVIGTRFRVSWQPDGGDFSLSVEEGLVSVSGPGADQQLVAAGQTWRSNSAPRPSITELQVAPEPTPPELEPPPARRLEKPVERERRSGPAARAPEPPAPSWRELALGDRYADAASAAERLGLARLCRESTTDDLLLLADAARLSAREHTAVTVYECARARGPAGARAAYGLGLIAFDRRRDHASAARWFQTYVREQPQGALAAEAMGRAIEAWHKAGDLTRSQDAARSYLRRFPAGAHAAFARDVLAPTAQ